MRKAFLPVLFLLCLSTSIFAQDSGWYWNRPIKNIEIKGLINKNYDDIFILVESYLGKPFTYDIYYEIADRLDSTDFFSDPVQVEVDETTIDTDYVNLIINVKEKPVVNDILIRGTKKLWKRDILNVILLKRGDMVSESDLRYEEDNIRKLYISKGFPYVKVTGEIENINEKNQATIVFTIIEGSESKIKKIIFVGNEFASESTLKGVMKTKEQGFLRPGVFLESDLEEDKGKLLEYYQNHGFMKMKILKTEINQVSDEEEQKIFYIITIYIEEGDQYIYNGITFEGNQVFSNERINELILLKDGKVCNYGKVQFTIQKIINLYHSNGYIYNQFDIKENFDEENKSISFHIIIKEFDRAHIENIIIQGNEKTKDFVIERELPFEEGDIFSVNRIQRGLYNLYNLQYFTAIDVKPVEGSAPGLMDLVITLEEDKFMDFQFAITFTSSDFPIAGTIGFSDTNFLGLGLTFGFEVEASAIRQGLSVNFLDNYFFNEHWGFGISFSFYHTLVQNVYQDIVSPIFTSEDVPDPYTSIDDWEANRTRSNIPLSSRMEYDEFAISVGLRTSFSYPIYDLTFRVFTSLNFSFNYVTYDSDVYRPYLKSIRDNLDSWIYISGLDVTFSLDGRDIYYNPTKGFYVSQYFDYTGGFLCIDRQYIRLKTRFDFFFPILRIPVGEEEYYEFIFAATTNISFVVPNYNFYTGKVETVTSPTDLWMIDGMNTGRGWLPVYDFKALWNNSLEIRAPINKEFIWWCLFFDMVGGWSEVEFMGSMSIEDFYFSYGIGVRLTIPQLPLRFYLSQRFQIINGEIVVPDSPFQIGPFALTLVISFSRPGDF